MSITDALKKFLDLYSDYTCEVTETDYQNFALQKKLLLRISEVENSSLTVYDLNKKLYLISCDRFNDVMGQNLFSEQSTNPEPLFRLMHPEDMPVVIDTIIKTFEFLEKLPTNEKTAYKLILDFRLKNRTGRYMKFIQQMVVLESDKNSRIWLILKLVDLLSFDGGQERAQRKLLNLKTGRLCLFQDDPFESSDKLLSGRETEILGLISQGMDSRKISEKLFISVNTVNNHRQKILSKTKTENTTQALLYAKKIGII